MVWPPGLGSAIDASGKQEVHQYQLDLEAKAGLARPQTRTIAVLMRVSASSTMGETSDVIKWFRRSRGA